MREVGVPFKGPLALANLEGRKTQTRRLVSSPKWSLLDGGPCVKLIWQDLLWEIARLSDYPLNTVPTFLVPDDGGRLHRITPRYRVGDRIWQREMWREPGSVQRADGKIPDIPFDPIYAADHPEEGPWRPSIHMPRRCSRGLFEITEVRGQRIQEIDFGDAKAEGVGHVKHMDPCQVFKNLWDSINGPRGAGWDSNPPVWAFTYRRIDGGS